MGNTAKSKSNRFTDQKNEYLWTPQNGVPQGSILSNILFDVTVNEIQSAGENFTTDIKTLYMLTKYYFGSLLKWVRKKTR